jgi:RNA polymerase sigma-70 factor (ECF subfamily)
VLAYLLLLTRSMAINRLNQRRNRWQLLQRWSEQLMPASVTSPQESAEHTNLAARVRAALAAIPANQRQVLELAYYDGRSHSGNGLRLHLPLGTVRARSRPDLVRLRELLIDFGNEP